MTETILTSDKSSDSSSLNPPSRTICHVCQKQFSQYTCPRCNSRYCSLRCYQTHSRRCTESFMRENVVDEMRQMQPDDESRKKMLEILKRFHSEEETDSMDEDGDDSTLSEETIQRILSGDDSTLSEETIQRILSGDDSTLSEETIQRILSGEQVNFDDLSANEKKAFRRAVASGELSKMIEPWDPWWLKPAAKNISLSKQGTQLVQPLSNHQVLPPSPSHDEPETSQSSEIPPGPENPLPPLSKLCSTEPSPLLAVHLVDILYSYCFTLRVYNGYWQSDALGSTMMVLSLSSVLGQGGQPQTVGEVLSHCLEQTCTSYKHMGGLKFGLGIIDDVVTLLSLGSSALVCSLCDLQRLMQAGERELKSEKTRKSRTQIRSKLKLSERKIYFMMCWVHEQPMEVWSSSAAIIQTEKAVYTDYATIQTSARKEDKTESRGKVLIEEIE